MESLNQANIIVAFSFLLSYAGDSVKIIWMPNLGDLLLIALFIAWTLGQVATNIL